MSRSKHFDKIATIVTAFILVITILFMNGSNIGIGISASTLGYENIIFDNSRVHTVDIVMNDWDSFIETCENEEYAVCAVVIDGEQYKNVGIRAKGNTSLSSVSSMGSDRYSFKIEFDQYDDTKSYHGLDKLVLNNLIQDNTLMKDYLTYTMLTEFGGVAPLCSYAYITVNGEDWGLYLALESIEDSFLERNYGGIKGELYKPDSMSMGGGRGNGKDFDMGNMPDIGNMPDMSNMPNMGNMPQGFDFGQMPFEMPSSEAGNEKQSANDSKASDRSNGGFGGFGGFGMGSSDVKLQYISDSPDDYPNIWNNAKTDVSEKDQARLIAALKKLTNGEDIENTVNVEDVIRYFVVHNFVCNGDSYTGSMIHNYYLYEENGMLSMLPWDYNLAYGTFQSSNANNTVNTPIDTPVSGSMDDRPMIKWIFEDEQYTEMYHAYFEEFLKTVDIVSIIDSAYELIAPYVKKDPSKFCTYEQFEKGVETIRSFCRLRSESIQKQLESGNTKTQENFVDASSLTISSMGSMGMGMGGRNRNEQTSTQNGSSEVQRPSTSNTDKTATFPAFENSEGATGNRPQNGEGGFGNMPQNGEGGFGNMPQNGEGGFGGRPNMPTQTEEHQTPSETAQSNAENKPTVPDATSSATVNTNDNTNSNANTNQQTDRNFGAGGRQNATINTSFGRPSQTTVANNNSDLIWLAVSAAVLLLGLIIAKKYKV